MTRKTKGKRIEEAIRKMADRHKAAEPKRKEIYRKLAEEFIGPSKIVDNKE
jgi:hypothetical protein